MNMTFILFIRKNKNYLRTNTDDATFSINVPISKNFQNIFFCPPQVQILVPSLDANTR